MPGLDARAVADPLVGGLDARLEPRIRDEPRGKRRADAGDGGVPAHGHRGYRTRRRGAVWLNSRAQARSTRERFPSGGGVPDGERSDRGIDPLLELRQDIAGPGLEERVRSDAGERSRAGFPSNRRDDVALQQRLQLVRIVDQGARDVLGDREPWRPKRHRVQLLIDRPDGGRPERRVERAGDAQPDRAQLPVLREALEAAHRGDRPTYDDLDRRVEVRDNEDVVPPGLADQRLRLGLTD